MDILEVVSKLELSDYWVCAGFIRNKVWDRLHSYSERTPYNDIDVIYFDKDDINESSEQNIKNELLKMREGLPWEVVNQARMYNNHPDVVALSAADGIKHFPETPTSIGIKLVGGELYIIAPHGIQDLLKGVVRPTPLFKRKDYKETYLKRINEKQWLKYWPRLAINEK